LLIQNEVKVYNQEELENQLLFMLIPYYTKNLQYLITNKEINPKEKFRLIRELKDKIAMLKKGKLI